MHKKLKVLQLGSPSGLYGAERWILSLIKYLDPATIESHVGAISDDTNLEVPLCVEAGKLGFPTHIIESGKKFDLSSIQKLKKCINDHQIDILHTHGYKTDLIGFFATRGSGCKILSTPHGWTKQPGLKLWLYEILDRLIFPFFDAVVPLSEGIFEPLCRIPGLNSKLHFVRNGVDIDEISNLNEISQEIVTFKNNGAYLIGYIGRLTPGKGLDVLFKAVADHAESNWKVVIIGEGEQDGALKTMVKKLNIEDTILFYGFRPDRLAFLKGFDVFVLPSRSEGTPRCLMEAMSAQIPVVASDIPGCRNLIDSEITGLLFELDDPNDLAKCIKRLINEKKLREKIKKTGKEFVQANFSAARMAKEYEKLFISMA